LGEAKRADRRGDIPQPGQKERKDMQERKRVKETALIRVPWGPAERSMDTKKLG
jgi:hypothetical protein